MIKEYDSMSNLEKNINEILDEFKEKKFLYEEFCLVMYKILDSKLTDGGYRYQLLYRIKEIDNLEEKIRRKAKEGKMYTKLEDFEDLAGLRILFYLEEDKKKFSKGLAKEFSGEVDVQEHKKLSGYEATHVTVVFGEKRISLSEYKKFEGMKCEIQLTSILHHAWSEIEHDIIYKNKFGIKSDKHKSLFVKKEMRKILSNYLIKASRELSKIVKKIKAQ